MRIVHPAKAKGQKIVVIVGAGFAGLNTAKALADEPEVTVILIDQKNHHLFQPLLYQVATAGLDPSDIAVPIRAQFAKNANVEIHMGQIEKIHLKEKMISNETENKTNEDLQVEYDYLVLACGARHSYFANPEWEEFAPGLKTLEQAIEIRKRIFSIFERAENEIDPELRKALLSFVIVGGGPTGVELAGAIADITKSVLVNDFKHIDSTQTKIILIEAGPRILPQFAEDLSKAATNDLRKMGVEVLVGTRVENITADGVQIANQFIHSRCVLWGAGVQAAPLAMYEPVERDRAGRIKVNADLTLPHHPQVFVAGDLAAIELGPNQFVPGLAPAAIQAGQYVAKKILADIRGKSFKNFHYLDKGQMATIGRHRAILQSGGLKLTGWLAWCGWFFVHLLYLVGFKNKVSVVAEWGWNYIFMKRGSRLIITAQWRLDKK